MDEYELEPYVYAQNILGDEHAQFGLGRNSWLSGTASWCYQAATKHILGIRPTYKGLEVDPCIPKSWDGFEVTRVLRGTTYKVKVKNPSHVSKGVKQLLVDGKPVPGHVIPLSNDGKVHEVEVLLGTPEASAHPHAASVNAAAPAAP
jgi:cellobiose phosphorylase